MTQVCTKFITASPLMNTAYFMLVTVNGCAWMKSEKKHSVPETRNSTWMAANRVYFMPEEGLASSRVLTPIGSAPTRQKFLVEKNDCVCTHLNLSLIPFIFEERTNDTRHTHR